MEGDLHELEARKRGLDFTTHDHYIKCCVSTATAPTLYVGWDSLCELRGLQQE